MLDTDTHDVAVAYKTVDAISGITDRKLWLRDEPKVSTDGTVITAPFKHPMLLRAVEKMLAHVLFQTDKQAIELFSAQYAKLIAEVCYKENLKLSSEQRSNLQQLIYDLCLVFETRRVTSLWGLIFEGSFEQINFLKGQLVAKHKAEANTCVATLAAVREAGIETEWGPLFYLVPLIDEALEKVTHKGPAATMAITKWVIMQIISQLLLQSGQSNTKAAKQRAQALSAMLMKPHGLPAALKKDGYDPVVVPKFNSFAKEQAKQGSLEALNVPANNAEELDKFLATTTDAMQSKIAKAKQATTNGATPLNEWLGRGSKSKVVFHDVSKADVKEYLESKGQEIQSLSPVEAAIVTRLRAIFQRVRSRRRASVEQTGMVVDPMAVIQRVIARQQNPVFREIAPGRGFDVLVLMDRSTSMGGTKKQQVERAGRVLAKALDYPFVKLHVWGFQSLEAGQIDLFKFDPSLQAYDAKHAQVGGHTPLHTAVHIAVQFLKTSRNVRHLIAITDGVPNAHQRDGKAYPRDQLIKNVRKEIQVGRQAGINILGAVIPNYIFGSNGQVQDLKYKPAIREMFGSVRYWRYLDPETAGLDLIQLVSLSFVDYLNG